MHTADVRRMGWLAMQAALLAVSFGRAQDYSPLLYERGHFLNVGVNANPLLDAHASYAMDGYGPARKGDRMAWTTQLSVPLFSQDELDFDWRIGAGYLAAVTGRFKVLSGLSWGFHYTTDFTGRFLGTGIKADVFPGFYGKRWTFAPHIAADYRPWVHIRHSRYSRETFKDLYPGQKGSFTAPRSGWFTQDLVILQGGVGMAYARAKWNLRFLGGLQYQPNHLGMFSMPDIGILPFYSSLDFGYRLPGWNRRPDRIRD